MKLMGITWQKSIGVNNVGTNEKPRCVCAGVFCYLCLLLDIINPPIQSNANVDGSGTVDAQLLHCDESLDDNSGVLFGTNSGLSGGSGWGAFVPPPMHSTCLFTK